MSGASSGRILPCFLYQSQLQSYSFHWKAMPCFAPTASSTRTPSGMTSRPMPSPGMTAIWCSFMGFLSGEANSSNYNRAMRFAAIETSSDWCSAALWADGEISSLERRAPNRHSELVLPMLFELLEKEKIEAGSLDGVAFGA